MENHIRSEHYQQFTPPLNKKRPSVKGLVRSDVSSITRISNTLINTKHKGNIEDESHFFTEGEIGSAFPSLSKGTLKTTSKITTSITNTNSIHISMLKTYPQRVKLFNFKNPFKTSNIDSLLSSSVLTTSEEVAERSQEQIEDSQNRSIARSKREMADLIETNDFDKFATLTFDPKKHPKANDYAYAKNIVIKWLSNQQSIHGAFRYVLIVERQKNGYIHFHAVLGAYTGKYHATNTRGTGNSKRQCYKIDSWEKSNGFADMEDIGNKQATANYIGKYLTKEFSSSLIQGKGERRYFASKNLARPTKTYDVTEIQLANSGLYDMTDVDKYENDFVIVKTIKKL